MIIPLSEKLLNSIPHVINNYYRLIFLVAESGEGKTKALFKVAENLEAPLINVNLELSRRMLEHTERQRSLLLPDIMLELINEHSRDILLLDNNELLFDIKLKQDPMRLLQNLSRNKTLIISWNGRVINNQLIYAIPDHPEYRKYQIKDYLVISHDSE